MAGASAGGAELFFERLTAALHRAGETVLPVIRSNPGRAARIAAQGLLPVQLPFAGAFDLLTRWGLGRALRQFRPSVTVAWMNRAARATPRGDWVSVGRLGGYYDLKYYRACDHLIGNTKGIAAWIKDQGWPEARVHHLPNFAPDLAGAAPATLPPGRTVLALGRLHRNKGFDVLVRALPHLPEVNAVIAGDGPERDALLGLARECGVADRLLLLGWREDGDALLSACDLLVCPSRSEPLGNVILEAFSASRPVVAAAVAGPLELIDPDRTGLLVPPEDPERLAAAIRTILNNQPLASRLAEAGRTEFEKHYAEAAVVRRWREALSAMASA